MIELFTAFCRRFSLLPQPPSYQTPRPNEAVYTKHETPENHYNTHISRSGSPCTIPSKNLYRGHQSYYFATPIFRSTRSIFNAISLLYFALQNFPVEFPRKLLLVIKHINTQLVSHYHDKHHKSRHRTTPQHLPRPDPAPLNHCPLLALSLPQALGLPRNTTVIHSLTAYVGPPSKPCETKLPMTYSEDAYGASPAKQFVNSNPQPQSTRRHDLYNAQQHRGRRRFRTSVIS